MTERDEFAYHECLAHLPLCSAETTCPSKHVLIVGGGDGGVLREVVTQYDRSVVQTVTVVDIDPMVVDVAKKYFNAAPYFDDERVTVVHQDAATFLMNNNKNNSNNEQDGADTGAAVQYNVIIGDTSDPVGPAESLFQPAFYESMYTALAPGGIICVQAESFWIHLGLISDLIACCSDIFDTAEYATTMVPTYPCGQIGFVLARKQLGRQPCVSCQIPVRTPKNAAKLKWYSSEMHRAAFVLPPFVRAQLESGYYSYDDTTDEAAVDRSLPIGTSNGHGNEEEDYECLCKDLASVLPTRIKDAFEPSANDESGETNDCFFGDPSKCSIM